MSLPEIMLVNWRSLNNILIYGLPPWFKGLNGQIYASEHANPALTLGGYNLNIEVVAGCTRHQQVSGKHQGVFGAVSGRVLHPVWSQRA